ncbi:MAG TPA: hypothetical protein VFA61_02000 [Candidatus Udaeobacter sp.]|nr:hypothetical protein [Candidatus Udaeobacter sp.]
MKLNIAAFVTVALAVLTSTCLAQGATKPNILMRGVAVTNLMK